MEQAWYLYLLRCADDTLYTGITNDPERRLAQHNAGVAAKYTRGRRPVSMVFLQKVADRKEALQLEAATKKLSRQQKLMLIQKNCPDHVFE